MTEALKLLNSHIDSSLISEKKTLIHVKYAKVLSNYGYSLLWQNKLHKAKEVLEKALELQEQYLHKNSIMTIRTRYLLGTVYHRCGQYDEAEKIKKIIEDCRNSLNVKDVVQLPKFE